MNVKLLIQKLQELPELCEIYVAGPSLEVDEILDVTFGPVADPVHGHPAERALILTNRPDETDDL